MSRHVIAATVMAVIAACGSQARPPVVSNHPASSPVAPMSDLAKLDPALPDAVAHATAIVEGTATATATRDGYLGTIRVDAVLAGVAPDAITFTAPPFELPADGIYFLDQTAGANPVLVPVGNRLGVPRPWADAIALAAPAPAADIAAAATEALASEIATFRAASGQPWSPSQTPAVSAAAVIFEQMPIAGRAVDDIVAALGEPDSRNPDGSIEYVRHMGEAGVIRRLRVHDGRVVGVEIHLTE